MSADRDIAGVILDVETGRRVVIECNTHLWGVTLEWLRFHGVEPNVIPRGTTVAIDRASRQVRFQRMRFDENDWPVLADGEPVIDNVTEQGEGIAPYPPEIAAALADPRERVRALADEWGHG